MQYYKGVYLLNSVGLAETRAAQDSSLRESLNDDPKTRIFPLNPGNNFSGLQIQNAIDLNRFQVYFYRTSRPFKPNKMIEIQCAQCKGFIARYKGSGELDLLLLDTVIKPDSLAELKTSNKEDLPLLSCRGCGRKLGKPAANETGRPGYKMIKGSFRRKGVIKAMTPRPHTNWRQ